MELIPLSQIPDWQLLNTNQLVNWLLENGGYGIINDYGSGIELEIVDLNECWDEMRPIWADLTKKFK